MDRRWMFALSLIATLGSVGRSDPPAPTADDLLAEVRADAPPRSAAKPDGRRFAASAARFAEVKHLGREPRGVAKPMTVGDADRSIPEWLRPTPQGAPNRAAREYP